MASGHAVNGNVTVDEQQISGLQELFKGRFPRDAIRDVLEYYHGDKKAAADHLQRGRLSNDREQDEQLQEINSRLNSVNLNDESVAQLKGKIKTTVRQFACGGCDRDWWQRVPVRKQVSKCDKCQKRYQAIDREDEYGWAIFNCDCGHKFSGFGQINKTTSECFQCGASVLTKKIQPRGRKTRKSDSAHQCDAADCAFKDCKQGGRRTGTGSKSSNPHAANKECVHPRSRAQRGKKVIVPSVPHISTGSTVDTFLPQDLDVLSDEERVIVSDHESEDRLHSIAEDGGHGQA